MIGSKFAIISLLLACIIGISMIIGVYISWNSFDANNGSSTPEDETNSGEGEKAVNIIVTGNANVSVQYVGEGNQIQTLDKESSLFGENGVWTAGHAEIKYVKLTNNGSNTVNYSLGVNAFSESGSVNAAGEEFKLSDYIKFGFINTDNVTYQSTSDAIVDLDASNTIKSGVSTNGSIAAGETSGLIAIVVYIPDDVADAITLGEGKPTPEIKLGLTVLVTQPMTDAGDAPIETP